nr:unnamed protein product [Callosobruchus analis]
MAAVIPAVTRISPNIIRILGCNPSSETQQGTNTYIIGTGKRRILIDCGEADVPQYINHLSAVLKYEGIDLAHIFISHGHEDHIGGLADIFEHIKNKTKHCQVWKHPSPKDSGLNIPKCIEIENFKEGQEFAVEGATIRILRSPGHTDDHVAFHLLEDNAVFSGDCILGDGIAVCEDLFDQVHSLGEIANLRPSVIYPGHGNIIHKPIEAIHFYMQHQMQRERMIIEFLLNNKSQSFNNEDLVKLVYENLPEKQVNAALTSINHHLLKLLKEDRVRNSNGRWQINDIQLVASY